MKKRILFGLLLILIVLGAASLLYLSRPGAAPQSQALSAMQSSDQVMVNSSAWITFTPTEELPTTGFIFYPGGKVEAEAYASVLHDIAAEGFLVVDVPMPFDLAVFGVNRAEDVIAANPQIDTWVIGGHSLGGVMAAEYAAVNLDLISGVAFWASYPAEESPLRQSGLAVISIYGTRDGLSTPDKIEASIPLLPADTVWVSIAGGNHAQFGNYGTQSGDQMAEISPTEQHAQIVQAMTQFLSSITP
jgi:hypothetical protein